MPSSTALHYASIDATLFSCLVYLELHEQLVGQLFIGILAKNVLRFVFTDAVSLAFALDCIELLSYATVELAVFYYIRCVLGKSTLFCTIVMVSVLRGV